MVPFGFNHMLAPGQPVPDFLRFARRHDAAGVELRNDVPGLAINGAPGLDAAALRRALRETGVALLSINALQRFNRWTPGRAVEAEALIRFAAEAGAAALVLCPVRDPAWMPDDAERDRSLREALRALLPMLRAHGITGLVEPLGFPDSSLRLKRDAVRAIDAVDGADALALLHDTFHHHISGETALFPLRTGLIHLSGIADPVPARAEMRDAHRGLVDGNDRTDAVAQLRALRAGGCTAPASFEPFAPELRAHPDLDALLHRSATLLRAA